MQHRLLSTLLFFTLTTFGCIFTQQLPAQPRFENLPLEERERIDREIAHMEREDLHFEPIPALDMAPCDFSDNGLFSDFQQTAFVTGPALPLQPLGKLYEYITKITPIIRLDNKQARIGLYGKDILKFFFMILNAYLDSFLRKNLFKVVVADFAKSLFEHRTDIVKRIDALSYDEEQCVVIDEAYNNLSNFINEQGFKPFTYRHDLSVKKITPALFQIVLNETSNFLQNQIFPPEAEGLLALFIPVYLLRRDQAYEFPISLHTVLALPLYLIFGISEAASSNAPFIRNMLLSSTNHNHQFLTTYWFYLIKRLITLTRFIKQNHHFYQKKFAGYFMHNIGIFKELLTNNPALNETAFKYELQTALKELDTTSFWEWYIFKNKSCNWTNFWIELCITAPALYTLGKNYITMQNHIQTGTTS